MDSLELVAYRNRKIDPNQVKRKSPKWLTNERKQAMIRMYLEYPDNCLQGHFLCPIREHYNHTQYNYYTYAVEREIHLRDDTEQYRYNADG